MPPSTYLETRTLIKRNPPTSLTTASELYEGKSGSILGTFNNNNDKKHVTDIHIKINGKWLTLSKEFVARHPGGSVIKQYK